MSRKKSQPEEQGTGAPAYIVTFSDMITLLLTFFVMLLSMAETQTDVNKFIVGQTAFKNAVANFGMQGRLFSTNSGPEYEHPKPKYKTEKGEDEPEDRVIDAKQEMLKRVMMDIEKMMKITPSQITGQSKTPTITDIHFERGSWSLDEPAKKFLKKYASNLTEFYNSNVLTVYVVGLASSEPGMKQQMTVSSNRAQAVADFLRENLPMEQKKGWKIYCWGAGPGGDWTSGGSAFSSETDIMITVLSNDGR